MSKEEFIVAKREAEVDRYYALARAAASGDADAGAELRIRFGGELAQFIIAKAKKEAA